MSQKPKKGDMLDSILDGVKETYQSLSEKEQLYVQVLYLTLVVSIFLSLAATVVRIYFAMKTTSQLGI